MNPLRWVKRFTKRPVPIVMRVDSGVGFPVAPSIKDASQWKPYLEKDVEKIIQAAIQGTDGGMDPKGDCDKCTEEEIRKAVEYMLSVVESR